MNILITGGCGYAGSVLVNFLSKKFKILVIDKILFKNKNLFNKSQNIILFVNDITNKKKTEEIFDSNKIDIVIHLAAIVGDPACRKHPEIAKNTNLNGSKIIFHLSKKYNVKKFIFFSTCSNYGLSTSKTFLTENSPLKPLSLYAKTKVKFEKFLIKDKSKVKKIILRLSTLYGFSPRMRFDLTVNEFLKKIYFKEKLEIYHKDTFRPYLSTDDLKEIILKIILTNFKKNLLTLNVGFNSENFTKEFIVKKINKILKLNNNYTFIEDKNYFDKRNYKVNFAKIMKFGIKRSHTFKESVKKMINFLTKITNDESNYKKFYNHK
jgi:nucleoside-diphosphate-sugar epimerase